MKTLKEKALREIRSHGYYGFFRDMKDDEKRFAIIREGFGVVVLEKVYKTKSNAMKVVDLMNNKDIKTIKRISAIHNPYDNNELKWHMVEFTVNECLQCC